MPRLRHISLLAAAALIAGCGSSDSTNSTSAPSSKAPVRSVPGADGGQLRVGATGSGIGSATIGSSEGIDVLPNTLVPGTPNTEQGVGAGSTCADSELLPGPDNLDAVRAATLCLLNGERSDAGVRTLKENVQLAKAALVHSEAMIDGQFFDHLGENGSDPVTRIRKTGYIPAAGTWTVGENLAWGTGSMSTPKAIVAAWMKSQGHRENILRPNYKEIGLGLASGNPRSRDKSGATFTTTFGAVKRAKSRRARAARAGKASRRPRARIAAPRGG